MSKQKIFNTVMIILIILSFTTSIFAEENQTANGTTNEAENNSVRALTLQEQRNQVQEQLTTASDQLTYVQGELSSKMINIQNLQDKISNYQKQLDEVNSKYDELQQQVKESEKSLSAIQSKYIKKDRLLKERLVEIYKRGTNNYLDVLLGSKDIIEFISNYFMIESITKYDMQSLDQLNEQKQKIEKLANELNEKKVKMKLTKTIRTTVVILSLAMIFSGCSLNKNTKTAHENKIEKSTTTNSEQKKDEINPKKSDENDTYRLLAQKDYKSGDLMVEQVNGGKSTLDAREWSGPKIDFADLDNQNRTGVATAFLDKSNYGKSEGREGQTWAPTGWHNQAKKVNGKRVFPQNRGHLIAYTMTFNLDASGNQKQGALGSLDNPKNLVTQTAYSNQELMQIYEQKVRDALAANKQVVYQVTPIFKDTELMARGLWLQAESTDDTLKFSVYIANVQPDLTFNYATGQSAKQHL